MSATTQATPSPTIGELLADVARALSGIVDSPRLHAELLLAEVLQRPRGRLLAQTEQAVPLAVAQRLRALAVRCGHGEPLAYVLGRREFWSLELRVTPDVLIPRPDTERLVECALTFLRDRPAPRVVDLGTGSGAIALALARERADADVTATDRSAAALAVARDNAARLGLPGLRFLLGDWYAPLQGQRFDLIVANPPYVARGDPALQPTVAAFEPATALYADDQGFADLARLVAGAPRHLLSGGALLLEHGATQAAALRGHLQASGFTGVQTWTDLAGHDRVSGGVWR